MIIIDKKDASKLEKLYSNGASYRYIAEAIGLDAEDPRIIKRIDNYVYKRGLNRKYDRAKRSGVVKPKSAASLGIINHLKKDEIIWLARNFCKAHGEPFLDHYNCFLREYPDKERIGFFDIESSGFRADWCIMLAYCILDDKTGKVYGRRVTGSEIRSDLDRYIIEDCVNDLKRFDKLVTYYGTKFDIPFVRTRAEFFGIDFPQYGDMLHKDVYYISRGKLKLTRNRLTNSCKMIVGDTKRTYTDFGTWMKASYQGNNECLQYIYDHCVADVVDLRSLYYKVIKYTARRDVSI